MKCSWPCRSAVRKAAVPMTSSPMCGVSLDGEVPRAQAVYVVHVMQKRGELLLPILSCCLPYPLKRVCTWPAPCPVRVALVRISLGQPPSLHRLRGRLPDFVRRLLRYYGASDFPPLFVIVVRNGAVGLGVSQEIRQQVESGSEQ